MYVFNQSNLIFFNVFVKIDASSFLLSVSGVSSNV